MTSIYWNEDDARLAKYSASTSSGRSGKTVVRIELEVTDSYRLGYLLDGLREIEAEQLRAATAEREAKAAAKRKPARRALPSPPLQLEYRGPDV